MKTMTEPKTMTRKGLIPPSLLKLLIISLSFVLLFSSSINDQETKSKMKDLMERANISCKLTTPELQERKKTVIAELKSLVRERKETENGVRYKFESSDKLIDLVSSFIKTERLCCDFFDFSLNVVADTGFMWLELSGPDGTKEFIREEIGF